MLQNGVPFAEIGVDAAEHGPRKGKNTGDSRQIVRYLEAVLHYRSTDPNDLFGTWGCFGRLYDAPTLHGTRRPLCCGLVWCNNFGLPALAEATENCGRSGRRVEGQEGQECEHVRAGAVPCPSISTPEPGGGVGAERRDIYRRLAVGRSEHRGGRGCKQ